LGLRNDSSVRLSYADGDHRCYATPEGEVFQPDVEHQEGFCLSAAHGTCPRFRTAEVQPPGADQSRRRKSRVGRITPLRAALWALVGVVAVAVIWQLANLLAAPPASPPSVAPVAVDTPTAAVPAAMPTPDPGFVAAEATSPAPTRPLVEEVTTPTVAAGDLFFNLTPQAAAVGWVSSNEARGNHLGDSFLHAGTVQGNIYHGVLQFDLSRVPRGAPLHSAALILTGLDDARLDRDSGDSWQLRWLAPEINEEWSRNNFQAIHNAPILQTILPAFRQESLAPFAINQFVFDEAQRSLLQQALVDNQTLVAFRLDGPAGGPDNLFTWDSGYGPASRQNVPGLWIVTGPAPATPPPIPTQDYVVVTSTPTPANVLTAAAERQTALAIETRIGTATSTPRTFVTATPTPLNESTAEAQRLALGLPFVVTPTPVPLNAATATANALVATAVAMTTGTWTPLPRDYVTATPTATFVAVTNTPTAGSIFELLDRVIAEATRTATAGPPTPFPPGVATATPTRTSTAVPQNFETAQAQVIMITVEAIAVGTWTPTPTRTPTATAAAAGTPSPAAPALAPVVVTLQEGAPVGSVIAEVVNVRLGPGVSFGAIGQAPNGVQLSLVGRSEDAAWLAVCCVDGQQGWVATFLIGADIDITTLPVLAAPEGARAPGGLDDRVVSILRVLRQSVGRLAARIG
jgi:hypothetical protein